MGCFLLLDQQRTNLYLKRILYDDNLSSSAMLKAKPVALISQSSIHTWREDKPPPVSLATNVKPKLTKSVKLHLSRSAHFWLDVTMEYMRCGCASLAIFNLLS